MPKATPRANGRGLPDDEPRYRIAHLLHDPVLRTALKTAEDDLGPIPVLSEDVSAAAGSDDARSIFHRAYCEANVERALYEFVGAQRMLAICCGEELSSLNAKWDVARDRMREAFERFVAIPAINFDMLQRKKTMIGPLWLSAYPVFREACARDEAYLKTRAAARREAAR